MKISSNFLTRFFALTLIAISLLILSLPEAFAASLRVSPVRVDLTPQATRSAVTVYNEGDSAFSVEARALTWVQQDGEDLLDPTTDLIVVPPIFELEPGSEQIVRIGLRGGVPDIAKELTYRLFVTQLPPEGGFTGLGSAIRFSIPVFITPPGAVAIPEWSTELVEPRQLKVGIANVGSAHIRIGGVKVLSATDREALSGPDTGPFVYILPGTSQEWIIDLTQDLPDGGYIVQAETKDGVLEQTFSSP